MQVLQIGHWAITGQTQRHKAPGLFPSLFIGRKPFPEVIGILFQSYWLHLLLPKPITGKMTVIIMICSQINQYSPCKVAEGSFSGNTWEGENLNNFSVPSARKSQGTDTRWATNGPSICQKSVFYLSRLSLLRHQ